MFNRTWCCFLTLSRHYSWLGQLLWPNNITAWSSFVVDVGRRMGRISTEYQPQVSKSWRVTSHTTCIPQQHPRPHWQMSAAATPHPHRVSLLLPEGLPCVTGSTTFCPGKGHRRGQSSRRSGTESKIPEPQPHAQLVYRYSALSSS